MLINKKRYNVLLLDDSENVQAIAKSLERELRVIDIYQAQEFFTANDILAADPGLDNIDIIITDLFILDSPEDGFTEEEIKEVIEVSKGEYLLFGWVWLLRRALDKGFPANKAIVFSAFLRDLADTARAKAPAGLTLFDKADVDVPKLIATIRKRIESI
jgi:hypothetical protein